MSVQAAFSKPCTRPSRACTLANAAAGETPIAGESRTSPATAGNVLAAEARGRVLDRERGARRVAHQIEWAIGADALAHVARGDAQRRRPVAPR